MRTVTTLWLGATVALVGFLLVSRPGLNAQPTPVKPGDIAGTVSSSKGPEAGVWVIAETTGLPTRYIKEVVTDDRGRYLIPDLPKSHVHRMGARLRVSGSSPKVQV